jgi:choline dehydrogenase-like flavoprotein
VVQANLTNNATFAAEARALYDLNRTGPYTRSGGDFLGFLPLTTYSSIASQLQEEAVAQDGTAYLAPETPTEVVEGYRAMHNLLTDHLLAPDSALIEMSWSDGRMGLNLQQPYSRGSVQAVSSSMFDAPIVDPRVLHNPLVVSFLVEAVRWGRGVVQTDAMAELQPVEVMPGAHVTSDEDLANVIRQQALPAWHLAGTCKMGLREEGGVVDDQLRVYGVGNLRVVDASIMPLLPAAHPMVTVYAVAEKVCNIRGPESLPFTDV